MIAFSARKVRARFLWRMLIPDRSTTGTAMYKWLSVPSNNEKKVNNEPGQARSALNAAGSCSFTKSEKRKKEKTHHACVRPGFCRIPDVNRGDAEQQAGQQRYATSKDGLGDLVGKEDRRETEKKGRKAKRELGIWEDLVPEEHDGVVDGHVALECPRIQQMEHVLQVVSRDGNLIVPEALTPSMAAAAQQPAPDEQERRFFPVPAAAGRVILQLQPRSCLHEDRRSFGDYDCRGRGRPKRVSELLQNIILRKALFVHAIFAGQIIRHISGAEKPVENREVIAVVAFTNLRILHMMPAMHFRADKDVNEGTDVPSHVGMAHHPKKDVETRPDQDGRVGRSEEEQGKNIDRAIQQLFDGMEPGARQEIHLRRAVMGFMQAPPPVPTMLQPMSNVKKKIQGEKNTDDLDKKWPVFQNAERGLGQISMADL